MAGSPLVASWELTFWQGEDGAEPVKDWIESLDSVKQSAIVRGLSIILADIGPEVCASEYGKSLGGGLCEFRLRHSATEIITRYRPDLLSKVPTEEADPQLTLRVFFHAHGDQMILLVGAYDKGKNPSDKAQQVHIRTARSRLKAWKKAQRASHFRPFWTRWVNRLGRST